MKKYAIIGTSGTCLFLTDDLGEAYKYGEGKQVGIYALHTVCRLVPVRERVADVPAESTTEPQGNKSFASAMKARAAADADADKELDREGNFIVVGLGLPVHKTRRQAQDTAKRLGLTQVLEIRPDPTEPNP